MQRLDQSIASSVAMSILSNHYYPEDIIKLVGSCYSLDDIDGISQNFSFEIASALREERNQDINSVTKEEEDDFYSDLFHILMEIFLVSKNHIKMITGNEDYLINELLPIENGYVYVGLPES